MKSVCWLILSLRYILTSSQNVCVSSTELTVCVDKSNGNINSLSTKYGLNFTTFGQSYLGDIKLPDILSVNVNYINNNSIIITKNITVYTIISSYNVTLNETISIYKNDKSVIEWKLNIISNSEKDIFRTNISTQLNILNENKNNDLYFWIPRNGTIGPTWTDPLALYNSSQSLAVQLGNGYMHWGAIPDISYPIQFMVFPLSMILSKKYNHGIALIHDINDIIFGASININSTSILYQRYFNKISYKNPNLQFRTFLKVNKGFNFRNTMNWTSKEYPDLFYPISKKYGNAKKINDKLDNIGFGLYSCANAKDLNVTNVVNQSGANVNWMASQYNPYLGMYLPPVSSYNETWITYVLYILYISSAAQSLKFNMNFANLEPLNLSQRFQPCFLVFCETDLGVLKSQDSCLSHRNDGLEPKNGLGMQQQCGSYHRSTNISIQMINQSLADFKEIGIIDTQYFNLFEYGQNVTWPLPLNTSKQNQDPAFKNSSIFLWFYLNDSLALNHHNEHTIEWQNGVLLDPDPNNLWGKWLINQTIERINIFGSNFQGISIDRQDHTRQYNYNHSDDLSLCINQDTKKNYVECKSLFTSWKKLAVIITDIIHNGSMKDNPDYNPIIANNYYYSARMDLNMISDIIFSEGRDVTAVGLSSMMKPSILWTDSIYELKDFGVHEYFQKSLYLNVGLMAPCIGNDHSIQPNQYYQIFYNMYANLFKILRGSYWWLNVDTVDIIYYDNDPYYKPLINSFIKTNDDEGEMINELIFVLVLGDMNIDQIVNVNITGINGVNGCEYITPNNNHNWMELKINNNSVINNIILQFACALVKCIL